MGSSKSGSLDKFAAFSPVAALASGKVKLPETGIVGMLQARQEDKMNQGAQMAQQDDNSIASYLDFYKQQMNPGMNMGGRVGMSMGGNPDRFAPTNTKPYNSPMSIGMGGTMIPKQSEQSIKQPYTGGMGSGTPPPLRPPMAGDPGVDPTPGPGIQPQPMPMPSNPEIDYMGSMNMGPATNPGPSPFEMTNRNTTNTGGMGSGTEMNNTIGMLQNLIQNNPMLGAQPGMLGGYAAGGPVESMNFLKQHLPYQDGGHVALRRKMFKLGGPVNTHGVGITSGLEYRNNYNAGGAVAVGSGNNPKVMGPDGQMREGHSVGSFIANAALFGLPKLVKFATKGKGTLRYGEKGFDKIIKKRRAVQKQIDELSKMKSSTTKDDLIKEFYRAGKLSDDAIAKSLGITRAGKGVAGTALKTGRALYPLLGPGVAGAGITSALMNEEPTTRGGQLAKGLTEGYLDFSGPGAIAAGVDYLNTPLDEEYRLRGLSDMLGGNKAKDKPTNDFKNENLGAPPTSYGDAVDDLQKKQMEEQIARYVELLQGNEDQNKLAMLGDSLIGAGSALMAGEGYGAAGQAFNDPLSEKLRARDDRKQAVRQGAAELAIGQDISRKTADEAMTRELLATGQIGTAEEIKKYNYAMALGADSLVPQNEKEELDLEALKEQGYRSRVLADPRNLVGQDALFLAINKSGVALPFNDIEAARQHAASE